MDTSNNPRNMKHFNPLFCDKTTLIKGGKMEIDRRKVRMWRSGGPCCEKGFCFITPEKKADTVTRKKDRDCTLNSEFECK